MAGDPHPFVLDSQAVVADVLARCPVTIGVFMRRRMACPGCAMAPFVSLAEAARSYHLDPEELVAELRAAAGGQGSGAQG